MPKVKNHSGASKRFKITGTGKIKKRSAFKSHNLSKKTKKQKRRLRFMSTVSLFDKKKIRKMLNLNA